MTDYDTAKIIYEIYKDKYKYTNKDKKNWYKYDEKTNEWVKINIITELKSEDVFRKIVERSLYYTELMFKTTDKEKREIYNDKSEEAIKIALRLKNKSSKNSIIKECKCLFIDDNFEFVLK